MNQWDLPQFHLSDQYLRLARAGQEEETAAYLRQKIQQARWVLACVRRRQETLEHCLKALVKAQEDYFWGRQEAPGPLLRWELAEELGVHPSTVTRTLRHKYIQCRQGLFSAAWFLAGGRGRGTVGPAGKGPDRQGDKGRGPGASLERPGAGGAVGGRGDGFGPADSGQVSAGDGGAGGVSEEAGKVSFCWRWSGVFLWLLASGAGEWGIASLA